MYVLYGGPFTRALLVEMVMAEGEIAYELRTVDILKDEHRAPAYLAINPAGWVPALITPEGETLTETPAINLYLAERHRLSHLAPRIDEPERGRFLSGLFFLTNDFEPWLKRVFYPERFALREDDAAAMKRHAVEGALDRLAVIDRRLGAEGPYHLGERFSLVDLTLAYWAVCLEPSGGLADGLPRGLAGGLAGGLAPFAAVRRCMALVMDRPKLRAKFDELRAGRDDYARKSARGAGIR